MNRSEKFTNRELSWLDFNYRCLSEARDKNIPLMERFKFLSITASNLENTAAPEEAEPTDSFTA